MGWFTEYWTDYVKLSVRIKKHVFSKETKYQKIDIYDSYEFGRFMALDGYIMLTERDEFIYHEMIAHLPMNANPAIRKVLVIGGGDGGTVRELLRGHGKGTTSLSRCGGRHGGNRRGSRARLPGVFAAHGACIR